MKREEGGGRGRRVREGGKRGGRKELEVVRE